MPRSLNALCWLLPALLTAELGAATARARTDAVAALVGAAAAVPQEQSLWTATGGELHLRLLPEAWSRLGLQIAGGNSGETLRLRLDGSLKFTAPVGKLDDVLVSQLRLQDPLDWLAAAGPLPDTGLQLHSVVAPSGVGAAFELRDARQRSWLQLSNAHSRLDLTLNTLQLRNMGVRIGSALAAVLGEPRLRGAALGMADVHLNVTTRAHQTLQPSSCAVPQWPSPATPGDVALIGLSDYGVMRGVQMDGPGGTDGEVVVAPSAALRNVGTRDIPWYTKYSGIFPPYGNDQHPFLVWSLYRMDADGLLVQHARSGVKHAFVTINVGCSCAEGNILGVGCSDIYDAFTNDVPFDDSCPGFAACTLGPRSEIVPHTGIWGRCGSIYDPNCNGQPEDTQAYGPFEHRLVARESAFDPAANPGSRQWLEAWYVVRDDGNIDNSMGATSILPVWLGTGQGGWDFHSNIGDFENGPVIERWVAAAPTVLASHSERLSTHEGQVHLAVRVSAVDGGRYRYQYALMNLDFSRAVLSGNQPDVRVERALGINRFSLQGVPAALTGVRFVDGDRLSLNDWAFSTLAQQPQWLAPGASHLAWGSLASFAFESSTPPRMGRAVLGVAEPGTPEQLVVVTLVPGSELFVDGFEP